MRRSTSNGKFTHLVQQLGAVSGVGIVPLVIFPEDGEMKTERALAGAIGQPGGVEDRGY